jgi:hypothetical protein
MSLIPPAPLILSKLKYHIQKRLNDTPELMEKVLDKLGPYYLFSLRAEFRSLENGTINPLKNMKEYIDSDIHEWDCIDTALNMYTRMKTHLTGMINNPGVLRISIVHRLDEMDVDKDKWFDLLLDEFPINVKGIKDDKGNELTLKGLAIDNNN